MHCTNVPVTLCNATSHLLSRNLEVRIYKTVILPAFLYGCEIWSLILRIEYSLTVRIWWDIVTAVPMKDVVFCYMTP
jgi:hypothetical protein